jgi:hypothetical protein
MGCSKIIFILEMELNLSEAPEFNEEIMDFALSIQGDKTVEDI